MLLRYLFDWKINPIYIYGVGRHWQKCSYIFVYRFPLFKLDREQIHLLQLTCLLKTNTYRYYLCESAVSTLEIKLISTCVSSFWATLCYPLNASGLLTHRGRVMHIGVGYLAIIGWDNGLSPGRHQAIFSTNDGILLIGLLRTNFSEILIEIHTFSCKKMHLKILSAKWAAIFHGLNMLTQIYIQNDVMAASLYLNRCWLIREVLWYSCTLVWFHKKCSWTQSVSRVPRSYFQNYTNYPRGLMS